MTSPSGRKPARLRLHWPTVVLVVVGVAAIVACAAFKVPADVIAVLAGLVAAAAGLSPPAASRRDVDPPADD